MLQLRSPTDGDMAVMTWPVLTLFAWYSEPLIVLLYGEQWRAAGQVLQIIAIASLFRTFEQPSRILLTSGAGLRAYILILGLGTLVLIGATIYLVEHGLYAVAMGIAAIQVWLFLVLLIQAMRLHQIPARAILAGIAAPLFALMGMFGTLILLGTPTGALYMTGWIGILGQILAACITYAVILVLFPHSLAREELLRLLGRVRMPRS